MMLMQRSLRVAASFSCGKSVAVMAAFLLTACGGGSGESRLGNVNGNSSASGWVAGEFLPSTRFENRCENPRVGRSPITNDVYPDRSGSRLQENNFLRSWSNETYLWYSEIVDRNPGLYQTDAYFDLLKTTAKTDTNADKDRFHFSVPTAYFEELFIAGESYGYGMEYAYFSVMPPRDLRVLYTHTGSPAHSYNIPRGSQIVAVDGIDIINDNSAAGVARINAAMQPEKDAVHEISFIRPGESLVEVVSLQASKIELTPVTEVKTLPSTQGKVGYIAFHDHISVARQQLYNAVSDLAGEGVDELVLDLRYNGGGYLDIASQLAYMIAGEQATRNKVFEQAVFNDKHTTHNPVTGQPLVPDMFASQDAAGRLLPTLNLSRVFVLTGSDTCSASEAIINGLRGIDIEVIQIGQTTCGKPYGYYDQPNCGTTYFSIQFRGENAKGYGDYGDGFIPSGEDDGKAHVLGCTVADDLSRELGDPREARLAAALYYLENNQCSVSATSASIASSALNAESNGALRVVSTSLQRSKIIHKR